MKALLLTLLGLFSTAAVATPPAAPAAPRASVAHFLVVMECGDLRGFIIISDKGELLVLGADHLSPEVAAQLDKLNQATPDEVKGTINVTPKRGCPTTT